jgi:hypothetical protein
MSFVKSKFCLAKTQSATKKAYHPTNILKEVAGKARSALSSTITGNTDQLGNKITISHHHVFKIISP